MADTEPNGYECNECCEVYPDVFECDHHGTEAGVEVTLTPCDDDNCQDDTHHWGLSMHVKQEG